MRKVSVFWTRILVAISFFLWPIIYPLILFRKRKKKKEKLKFLVVPQLTRIGDIICSTPVFSAIEEKYPKCCLVVLSSLNAVGIIRHNTRIDEIIIIEDYQDNFLGLIKKIQKENFDYGISLSGTALSSILFFFGLIPSRVKIVRDHRPWAELLTDWMCNVREKYVELSYLPAFYLRLLRFFGVDKIEVKKEVFWTKEAEKKTDEFFCKNKIGVTDRLAGISLSAGNKVKEWGDDKFKIVAREISNQYGMKVIFIGGMRDKERINKLIKELGGGDNYINGTGFALEELPALMKRFKIFISADTGPVHIAEALSIPLIDILGPVNDIELTPRGETARIVKPAPDIPPTVFAFREAGDRELTKKALDSISADKVISVFQELAGKYIK